MSRTEIAPGKSVDTRNRAGVTSDSIYDKCIALASNLWWSWHPEVINLFRDLDPIRWRQLDHNPIALLSRVHARAAGDAGRRAGALQPHQPGLPPAEGVPGRRRRPGAAPTPACWARSRWPISPLEFGVHESVPIYSGGLGVLSGDHIKSASGLGVPLVAIGLFYDQGYFKQHLDINGWQQEEYLDTKVENLPMEPARGHRRQADHRRASTPAPASCWPRCG